LIILGIDPGYAIVGYGALRFERGQYRAIGFGAITTEAGMDFSARLQYIYDNMMEMIRQCRPDAVAIEKLYFHTNQKTVIHVRRREELSYWRLKNQVCRFLSIRLFR